MPPTDNRRQVRIGPNEKVKTLQEWADTLAAAPDTIAEIVVDEPKIITQERKSRQTAVKKTRTKRRAIKQR